MFDYNTYQSGGYDYIIPSSFREMTSGVYSSSNSSSSSFSSHSDISSSNGSNISLWGDLTIQTDFISTNEILGISSSSYLNNNYDDGSYYYNPINNSFDKEPFYNNPLNYLSNSNPFNYNNGIYTPNDDIYDQGITTISFQPITSPSGDSGIIDTDTNEVFWKEPTNKTEIKSEIKVDTTLNDPSLLKVDNIDIASNNGSNNLSPKLEVKDIKVADNKVDIAATYNYNLPPSTCDKYDTHCWKYDEKGNIIGEVCKKEGENC